MSEEVKNEELVEEGVVLPNRPKKKEHLLGTILLVLIIFFILSSLIGIIFVGYTQWQHAKEVEERPTIETLSEESKTEEAPAPLETPKEEPKQEEKSTESVDLKKQKVAVLNGGAAAGSAAKLAEALKKEGLETVNTGSTEGDFTGTVVYYAETEKAAAEALLVLVKKNYSNAEAKVADSSKKETSTEKLTVILGETK